MSLVPKELLSFYFLSFVFFFPFWEGKGGRRGLSFTTQWNVLPFANVQVRDLLFNCFKPLKIDLSLILKSEFLLCRTWCNIIVLSLGRYELVYEDAESQSCLERSLGVSLLRKVKNQVSGVVILVFNFVFSPFKPFRYVKLMRSWIRTSHFLQHLGGVDVLSNPNPKVSICPITTG